ncbi:MAG: YraN family protein [Nitrospiria bacterium]
MSTTQKNLPGRPRITGLEGEEVAASFLKRRGYRILERNYRTSFGEIDIIATEDDVLVFVEVKARSGTGFGPPEASIDFRKQKKLSRVALAYLSRKKNMTCPCRFDVVAVLKENGQCRVRLIQDAFEMSIEGI